MHDATSRKAASSKHCLKGFGLMMTSAQVMQHVFLAVLMFSSSTKKMLNLFICNAKSLIGMLKC